MKKASIYKKYNIGVGQMQDKISRQALYLLLNWTDMPGKINKILGGQTFLWSEIEITDFKAKYNFTAITVWLISS